MTLPRAVPPLLRAGFSFQQRALKRVFRENVRGLCSDAEYDVETPYGFVIGASPRDWLSHTIYFYGTYDETLTKFIQSRVVEGDVCWDVGAGIGWFSLLMARCVGPSGRVDAFEAFPPTYAKLARNRDSNQFAWLRTHATAVSDAEGELYFVPPNHVPARRTYNSGLGHLAVHSSPGCATVRTSTLDQLASDEGIDRLNFVKLDIEGYESAALRGAARTLRRFKPTLAVEYNPHALLRAHSSVEELDAVLDELGYDRYVFTQRLERLALQSMTFDDDTAFNVFCLPRR